MDWFETYTGKRIDLDTIGPDDICIEDIAHSLSNQCRFMGHCRWFYSVAQHSVYVSGLLPLRMRLMGLLHDASEAYVGDLIRPLKYGNGLGGEFQRWESRVWSAILAAFDLPWDDVVVSEVKRADDAMLAAEASQLMRTQGAAWKLDIPAAPVEIVCQSARTAENVFLSKFREMMGGAK